MASIWLHPKSPNWFARFRGAKGKTLNRSTGITDRKEAERIAQQWEIEAARERQRDLKQPDVSSSGISDAISRLERLARQDRVDAAVVRDVVNGILIASGHEAVGAVTSRGWCDTWRKSKSGAVAESSKTKYEQVCRDWLAFLGAKADKPLELISKADVVAFRDSRAKTGLASRTVNEAVKLIRCIYAEAVEQGHLGRNPFAGVDPLKNSADHTRRLPFTSAEVATLIRTAEGEWRGVILVAATTGLRLKDVAKLRWGALNLEESLIRIRATKNGAYLTLPIHTELLAWLSTQTRGIGAAPLFPKLSTKSGSGNTGLSESFKRLMKRAGISDGKPEHKSGNSGRRFSQKSFHSLRHFTASQLATAGVRSDVACHITGHADAEVHGHYVTPDVDALRDAVKTIRLCA